MSTTLQTEFLKLIETRRSIRAYEPTPVPENLLQSILQAGMYAPTGGGRQSPTIVAITSKQVRDQLSAYNAKVMHTRSDPYYGAPVILVVLAYLPKVRRLWRTAAAS